MPYQDPPDLQHERRAEVAAWGRLNPARPLAAIFALGVVIAFPVACASAGAAPTSLSTSLSGGGKSGETITVIEGTAVKDQATLSGENASKATGTVKYAVYSEKACKELVTKAGEVTVKEGKIPASEEKKLEAGAIYYWQAVYSGDANNSGSTSPCGKEVLTVKATTSLKTLLSGGGKEGEEITVVEGTGVKDTATLSGTNSSKATGTVKYAVYKDKACKELVTKAGEGGVESGKAAASEEKKLEAGTIYYWQAEYGGDSLHEASTSACGKEILTVKATTSLKTLLSGGGKEGEEITVAEGSKVKDQATISGTNSSTAKGTVKYAVYKDKACKELATKAGEGEVKEGKAAASEEKELEAGTIYYWQAEYGGDSLHEASTSACGKEVETVKSKTTLATSLLGDGEEGAEITISSGSPIWDSASLSGTQISTATGTVKYAVYSDSKCEKLVIEAGEGSVTSGGVPLSEEEKLEPGTYYWKAEYSGDSLHEASVSICGKEIATVKFGTSLTGLLSGEGKEEDDIVVAEGSAASESATLAGAKSSTATGTIEYAVYSDEECKELVTKAGEGEVKEGKVPASEEKKLEPGYYYWQAVYSGDGVNKGATSECGSDIEIVTPPITTALSAGEQSAAEVAVLSGTAVSDKATLYGPHSAEATGTIKYAVYKDKECKELVTKAGEGEVKEGKVPASEEKKLEPGTYYWQVVYSGDEKNPPATSSCGTEVLNVVTSTSLTTSLAGGGKEGTKIEVELGTAVADQGTLSGVNVSTAEGFVEYAVYSDSGCTDLAALAGSADVKEGKAGSSSKKTLPVGTYYWQAVYSGDGASESSTSECGSEVETVTAAITTNLSGGEQSGDDIAVEEGTAISDQATLHGPYASEATGTIKYAVYSDTECKVLVTKAGEREVKEGKVPASEEKKLKADYYYWQAVYSGDAKNPSATSACSSETAMVQPAEATKYAALGDSYSSGHGLGAAEYYTETNNAINQCHRSKKSWPALVAEKLYNAGVVDESAVIKQQPPSFIFRACAGAVLDNLWKAGDPTVAMRGGQYPEVAVTPSNARVAFFNPAQDLWLEKPGGVLPQPPEPNGEIKLVTLTIGGNNAGFSAIGGACVEGPQTEYTLANCQTSIANGETAGLPAIEAKLPVVLWDVRAATPNARIRVPLYPRILNTARRQITVATLGDLRWQINNALAGAGGRTAARSIDRFIGMLNLTIEETVDAVRAEGVPVKVIRKTQSAFDGHRLGDNVPWINGVFLPAAQREESFHPNLCGYQAIARRVVQAVGGGTPPADC
jgi:hypothetical protein